MSRDLSPNDPRAVVEDERVMSEEVRLRRAGRLFILGLRVAVVALLVLLLVPSEPPVLRMIRRAALHATWISLVGMAIAPAVYLWLRRR